MAPVSRSLVFLVLILGVLFIIFAFLIQLLTFGFVNTGWLYGLGILMIISSIFLALMPGGILRKEQVLDSWGILIEKGSGKSEEIFKDTENFLKESKAPNVEAERTKIAPGVMKWIIGAEREFLKVRERSASLHPYNIFIGARDYGENLDVSWYLTFTPSLIDALVYLLTLGRFGLKTPKDLDLFELQDLSAYATNCHHSLLKAVEKLMLSLNQDPSKINRRSRGFLGVS
ncbi:hypothetical protein [Candidatus Methanodesulfokora washburnensis]|jgi:hypothetical protein|uniref:Uncharacterized protein n=1 Tax=Candidatus Methanodesulfokora washburnensis TaxID=2478471 RepID=A0A429GRF2_9CREN|nr:hypothetical protein [Candidatus Methanodesulfokores washburnensis]RSN76263.1 hypothetical protein D6D85_04745 [Candidatus Methanodesulfokores washburnensis]